MKYSKILEKLSKIEYTSLNPSLDRIKEILDKFNNLQDIINAIHIAGSNGKGSVAYLISKILIENQYKVGLYTSPHISSYLERIKINGKEIKEDDIEECLDELVRKEPDLFKKLTYFEVLTAIMFLYFYRERVDFAVLEAGLGGRFDATNLIKNPLLSIITTISLEHTDILGKNISKIAYEKGGIIKSGKPVLCGVLSKSAKEVIKKIAKANGSPIYSLGEDFSYKFLGREENYQIFSYFGINKNLENLKLSLLGPYQLINASLALAGIEILEEVNQKSIYKCLENAYWPGRFEIKNNGKNVVVIDGAHNPEACEMLQISLNKYFGNKKFILLMGVLKDKNFRLMCKKLSPIVKKVFTFTVNSPRSLSSKVLANVWEDFIPKNNIFKFETLKDAWENVKNMEANICITGSLYSVGEALNLVDGTVL